MNRVLTEQIAFHILANLGVLSSSFVDRDTTRSLMDSSLILPEKIKFEDEGKVVRKNIYGLQVFLAESKELRLLLADCTQDQNIPEFALLVQLKDAPAFGMYAVVTKENIDSEVLIAVSTDKKNWMPCSMYLQATFLAGMEQIRDVGFGWTKATNYSEQYQQLLSFIKFHHSYYQEDDEGQEK